MLAHHWRQAGEVDAARGYLLAAAERARAVLAVEQTYDLFTRALELATTDEERRRIRLRRGLALTELEDFPRADEELAALLPELSGADELEALIARSRATTWTEQATETLAMAERALSLVRSDGPAELEGVALAHLSRGLAMRGEEGDLDRAKELGDRALELWPGEERPIELAEQYHMQANVHYWTGSYERSLELSERAAAIGGLDPRSAEFLLRGAGVRGLALAGMGRYEEAIAVGDRSIETARRLGRKDSGVMNYSTSALREVFALDEARERSETVVDRLGPSWFRMAMAERPNRPDRCAAPDGRRRAGRADVGGRVGRGDGDRRVGALDRHGTARGGPGRDGARARPDRRRGDLERAGAGAGDPRTADGSTR